MFVPHGDYRVEIQDKVILIEAKGPFNDEAVNDYAADMLGAVKKMKGSWGQLTILHQDSLFIPQAEESICQSILSRKLLGLTQSAIVIVDSNVRLAVECQVTKIYEKTGVECQFFQSEDRARKWLIDSLA